VADDMWDEGGAFMGFVQERNTVDFLQGDNGDTGTGAYAQWNAIKITKSQVVHAGQKLQAKDQFISAERRKEFNAYLDVVCHIYQNGLVIF